MRNLPLHAYGRSPDGGSSKRGFVDYTSRPGDTRQAIGECVQFLGQAAWSSRTFRVCLAFAGLTACILATTTEKQRLAPASRLLIGEHVSGSNNTNPELDEITAQLSGRNNLTLEQFIGQHPEYQPQ